MSLCLKKNSRNRILLNSIWVFAFFLQRGVTQVLTHSVQMLEHWAVLAGFRWDFLSLITWFHYVVQADQELIL